MYHLHLDHEVTRRKRWHYITDPEYNVVYSSHRSSDLWQWLDENDIKRVSVEGRETVLVVEIIDRAPF